MQDSPFYLQDSEGGRHHWDIIDVATAFSFLAHMTHQRNAERGWWTVAAIPIDDVIAARDDDDPNHPPPYGMQEALADHVVATKVALAHTELSEALEAFRKSLPDEQFPQYPGVVVELIDTIIRCFDLLACVSGSVDIGKVFCEITINNTRRPDHDPVERAKRGGKKF